MNIKNIIIMLNSGADIIYFVTDLPAPFECHPEDKAALKLEVSKNKGKKYVEDNFPGIPYEIIDTNVH